MACEPSTPKPQGGPVLCSLGEMGLPPRPALGRPARSAAAHHLVEEGIFPLTDEETEVEEEPAKEPLARNDSASQSVNLSLHQCPLEQATEAQEAPAA